MIHAAGAPAGGTSARPKTLVVLVKTNARTPACGGLLEQVQRAGDVGVDEVLARVGRDMRLVQRRGVEDRVHARHAAGDERAVGDRADVVGERRRHDIDAERPGGRPAGSVRISASPRWPALPVTRTLIR